MASSSTLYFRDKEIYALTQTHTHTHTYIYITANVCLYTFAGAFASVGGLVGSLT